MHVMYGYLLIHMLIKLDTTVCTFGSAYMAIHKIQPFITVVIYKIQPFITVVIHKIQSYLPADDEGLF